MLDVLGRRLARRSEYTGLSDLPQVGVRGIRHNTRWNQVMAKKSSTPEKKAEALAKHLQESLDDKHEGLSDYVADLDLRLISVRFEDGELKLVFDLLDTLYSDSNSGQKRELSLKPTGWRKV